MSTCSSGCCGTAPAPPPRCCEPAGWTLILPGQECGALARHWGRGTSPAAALRALGIDAGEVRQRLEASFGADALCAAEHRVRRRPRWRGGHPRPSPLCVYLLAKRAMAIAARFAADRGDAEIGPQHLLYGVLQDARDQLGAQLSRRGRRQLAPLGFVPGRPNPVQLQLQARGIDLQRLAAEVYASP